MAEDVKTKPTAPAEQAVEAFQKLGFGPMNPMGTAWIETMGEMGSELVSFVADRVKEDVKTQQEVLHCKDIAELQRIQTEFFQKAFEQYTAETGKIVEIGSHLLAGLQKPSSDGK
ncbi:MAG: phasin family protein [Pseudomonadota bacterium]